MTMMTSISKTIRTVPVAAAALLLVASGAGWVRAQTQIASRIDAAPSSHPLTSALKIGRESVLAMEQIADYEAIFVKKEILGGRLVEQKMRIRFREQPRSIHLQFIDPHNGREVLYVEGRNNNKLQVKDSGLIALVGPISLDPTSAMAMKETVYPITEIGIRTMLERLLTHWLSETSSRNVTVKFYPNARIGKTACQVVEATHNAQGPGVEYHKLRLYRDKETGLPIRVQQLGFPKRPGGEAPVVADYTYLSLKTNLGLSDRDFSLGN